MRLGIFCGMFFLLAVMLCTPVLAEGWVRLEINGTDVNLRSVPNSPSTVLAQANTGDVFIAEKWPVLNQESDSNWYKLVWAVDKEAGAIVDLAKFNQSLSKGTLVFVNEKLINVLPLAAGEEEQLIQRPYGATYDPELGTNLPALVREFGAGEIDRHYNADDNANFGIAFYTIIELAELKAVIAESSAEGQDAFAFFYITLSKPGFGIDEFHNGGKITVGQSGKAEVEKIFKSWAGSDRTITKNVAEDGSETWSIAFEMNGVDVTFGANGLVTTYHRWVSIH